MAFKKREEIGTLQMMAHLLATGGPITRSEEGLKDTPLPHLVIDPSNCYKLACSCFFFFWGNMAGYADDTHFTSTRFPDVMA